MRKASTVTVTSSHGSITIDDTGHIFSRQIETGYAESGLHLKSILRFNITEWCQWYCKTELPAHIDILDLGYWYMLKPENVLWTYTPPDVDWRNMMIELHNAGSTKLKQHDKGEYNARH